MSNPIETTQSWSDPRHFVFLIAPFGVLPWLGGMAVCAYIPYMAYFTEKGLGVNEVKKSTVVVIAIIGFLIGLYFLTAAYQVLFLELKERFIVRKAVYQDGEFDLKGYYFKEDGFKAADVVSVEEVVADPRWFSKRTGTMLTRNPKVRYNFSLKATLKDGRVFYFPGEMFEIGGIETMRDLLEAGIQNA
jgi:hypothetical protein